PWLDRAGIGGRADAVDTGVSRSAHRTGRPRLGAPLPAHGRSREVVDTLHDRRRATGDGAAAERGGGRRSQAEHAARLGTRLAGRAAGPRVRVLIRLLFSTRPASLTGSGGSGPVSGTA